MTRIITFLFLSITISAVWTEDIIDVFGIAKCPDTTKFVRNQLVPFYEKYNSMFSKDFKIDFHSVPIGGGTVDGKYRNKCLHGATECDLNKMQMCSKKYIEKDWMVVAGCIQGRGNYTTGLQCLPDTMEGEKVKNCTETEDGEYLLNDENSYRFNVAPGSSWLPWIQVNGEHSPHAEHNLIEVVCQLASMKDSEICKKT